MWFDFIFLVIASLAYRSKNRYFISFKQDFMIKTQIIVTFILVAKDSRKFTF